MDNAVAIFHPLLVFIIWYTQRNSDIYLIRLVLISLLSRPSLAPYCPLKAESQKGTSLVYTTGQATCFIYTIRPSALSQFTTLGVW